MVASIESPADCYKRHDGLNVGVTYDAIILHYMPSDSDSYIREDIYIYDKKNIEENSGEWEKICIEEKYDEKSNTLDLQMKQE